MGTLVYLLITGNILLSELRMECMNCLNQTACTCECSLARSQRFILFL